MCNKKLQDTWKKKYAIIQLKILFFSTNLFLTKKLVGVTIITDQLIMKFVIQLMSIATKHGIFL